MSRATSLFGRVVSLPAGRATKWLVVLGWLGVLAGAVPLAGMLEDLDTGGEVVEMPRGTDATRVAALADEFPDNDVATGIVVYAREGGLSGADQAAVERDADAMAAVAVDEIASVPSEDGSAMMLVVPVASDQETVTEDAGALRDIAQEGLPDGLDAYLTGQAGASLDAADAVEQADTRVTLVTLSVVVVVLLVVYRSPVLWLLPLVTVGTAFLLTRAVQYLLGEYAGLTVNPENAPVLTVLVLGVGTDYCLLLLARYREELRVHADRHSAMAVALRGALPAILASAATVSLGLLCLLAADMGFNYTLGTAGAIAIGCAFVATTVLLPALLMLAGRWVFWPLVPRTGTEARHTFWERVGRGVSRHPRLVWGVAVLILAGFALGVTDLRTGLSDQDQIVGTPESVAGQELLAAHFPAGRVQPVQVVADAGAEPAVQDALARVGGVAEVGPPVRSGDGELVRLDAVLADPVDSVAAEDTVEQIRGAVSGIPGADAVVGGATAERMERDAAQAHDRQVVIPLVLAVVFLVLVLLLRAVVAPVLLMATVVLSFFTALGASWLIFDNLLGFPAVDSQLALVGFLFLVALGVDYNIFLVTRVREEAARHGPRQGVLRGLAVTGGVITSAGVVLAATFSALTLAPQVAFVQVGVLVALGVLVDSLLVRSVVVPALGLDTGRWFWWPGRLSRRGGSDAGHTAGDRPAHGVVDSRA